VRLVLAALFAVYIALVAAMPHGHGDEGALHHADECIACTTAATEVCEPAPPVAPRILVVEAIALAPVSVPSSGAPLGAVPGQSPPAA
jgi:hypothetical protein